MENKKILIGTGIIVLLVIVVFWQQIFGVFWNNGGNKGCDLTDTEAINLAENTDIVKVFTQKYPSCQITNASIMDREDEHGRELWYEVKKNDVVIDLVVFVSYHDSINNKCEKKVVSFDLLCNGRYVSSGFPGIDRVNKENMIAAINEDFCDKFKKSKLENITFAGITAIHANKELFEKDYYYTPIGLADNFAWYEGVLSREDLLYYVIIEDLPEEYSGKEAMIYGRAENCAVGCGVTPYQIFVRTGEWHGYTWNNYYLVYKNGTWYDEIYGVDISDKPLFQDNHKIINTASFYIKSDSPLTEEQIQILKKIGVRELYKTSISTIYYGLVEKSEVDKIQNLGWIKSVYEPKII